MPTPSGSSDAFRVAKHMAVLGAAVQAQSRVVVRHHTLLLETAVKKHASGRPGPNAPTGSYRRSVTRVFGEDLAGFYGIVGTNFPQGRRLEFGFIGADSLGRVYNQPPYPHFGPAFNEVAPKFVKAMKKLVGGSGVVT